MTPFRQRPRYGPRPAPPRSARTRQTADADQLCWALDATLPRALAVARGNVLYLSGWCFHPHRRVRRLHIAIDGAPVVKAIYGIVRPDREDAPESLRPNTTSRRRLTSGFVAAVPIRAIAHEGSVTLSLRVQTSHGRCYEQPVGTLTLLPAPPRVAVGYRHTADAPDAPEPLIAICMATYNPDEALLRRQIASIREQTYRNWLCIVNDDCSTPAAFDTLRRLVGDDDRFVVSQNEARLGFYHNFERALMRVPREADLVALADQDDDWYPDKLAEGVYRLRDGATQLVYSDMRIVAQDGTELSDTFWSDRRNNYTDLPTLLFANTVSGAASLFRATLLDDVLPFPPEVGSIFHDHWIACAALLRGGLGYIDRPLYAYRQHSANVVGHTRSKPWRFLPLLTRLRQGTGPTSLPLPAHVWTLLWAKRRAYFDDVLRLAVIAQTLRLRFPHARASQRRVLHHFARFDGSLLALLRVAILSAIRCAPTFGAQWHCLNAVVANRLVNASAAWFGTRTTVVAPRDSTESP